MDEALQQCFSPRTLRSNLAVLEVLAPEVAELLTRTTLDRPDIQLELLAPGCPGASILFQRHPRPLHTTPDPVAQFLARADVRSLGPVDAVVWVGVGLGYELEALLDLLPPSVRVYAIEPDPFWVYLTLSRVDLTEALLARRLSFRLGSDVLRGLDALPARLQVLVQAGLELPYRWEVASIRRFVSQISGRFQPIDSPTFSDSWGIDWPSSAPDAGPHPAACMRICLAEGELFFDDLASTLLALGADLHILRCARLTPEEVIGVLHQIRPDVVLSVDLINDLGPLCARAQVPYVVWEINPRSSRVPSAQPEERPWVQIFTYRKRHVSRYRALGYARVTHLPLAANPRTRRPLELSSEDLGRYQAPISFVGHSLVQEHPTDQALVQERLRQKLELSPTAAERSLWTEAARRLAQAISAQQSDLMRPVLIEQLERDWAELGLTPELEIGGGEFLDLRIVYSRMFGARRRAAFLQMLAPFGVTVFGDPGWKKVLPTGVYYRGPAAHAEELTCIYNACTINLDIGRLYQLDIVTMRVFDILACGAFPLVEYSEELTGLFEIDREVIGYRTWTEARDAAHYFLEHPLERAQLAAAGRARVLRDHTIEARLRTLLSGVKS